MQSMTTWRHILHLHGWLSAANTVLTSQCHTCKVLCSHHEFVRPILHLHSEVRPQLTTLSGLRIRTFRSVRRETSHVMHVSVRFSEVHQPEKPSLTLEPRACAMVFPRSSLDCTPWSRDLSENGFQLMQRPLMLILVSYDDRWCIPVNI